VNVGAGAEDWDLELGSVDFWAGEDCDEDED